MTMTDALYLIDKELGADLAEFEPHLGLGPVIVFQHRTYLLLLLLRECASRERIQQNGRGSCAMRNQ